MQFSTCFTLPVIYLTLTLPATLPTELSAHPGDLTEFFFGLWDFFFYTFFYWFAACRMYYMLHQLHTGLPSWTHPSSVRNVRRCRNRFTAVVQKVSRSALSLKGHPMHVHEDTNTHTANINMCSQLSRCATNKDGGSTSSLVEGKFCSGFMSWPEQNNSSSTLNQQVFCVNREVKDIRRCLVAEINRQGSRCGGKWTQCVIFYVCGKFPVSTAETRAKIWGVALKSKLGQVQSDQSKKNSEAGRFTNDCSYLPE